MEYILFLPLFAPGLALSLYFLPANRFSLFERMMMGVVISPAFYPLFLLLFYVIKIAITPYTIYAIILISLIISSWLLYPTLSQITLPKKPKPEIAISWLFLLIILAMSAYVRIAIAADLKVGMWADSYHHTMISQLMIDNNGLFSSWLPYVPLKTFTYHFGFHSVVATYHWLTGLTITRAVVVTGQMLNFLTVLSCYLLARRLTNKEWAGNFAALFVGLISPMPFFYVNWGRYTQLAGLVLLPPAIILLVELFNRNNINKKLIIITSIVTAGLGLSHYGVLVFFILFGGLFIIYKMIDLRAESWAMWRKMFIKLLTVTIITGLLTAPWILNFLNGRFMLIIQTILKRGANDAGVKAFNNFFAIPLNFFLPTHWYILAILGIGWATWRREKWPVLIAVWGVTLMVLANPHYLGLPGTGLINNFAIFISLFLPISVILSNLVADIIDRGQSLSSQAVWLVAILLLALGYRSIGFRLGSFQPTHQLVTEQDFKAMEWIKENTPSNAKFLINDFLAYGNSTVVGSDAGWWIPLLTDRQTNVPPIIYLKEIAFEDDYIKNIKQFQQQTEMNLLLNFNYTPQQIAETGITHIYIGQQDGKVWYNGNNVLDAKKLETRPLFEIVYQEDKVTILAVKAEAN